MSIDPHTLIKSVSIPRHNSRGNFDPCAQVQSSSIPYTVAKTISNTDTKYKSVSLPAQRQSWLIPVYRKQVIFNHQEQQRFISPPTLKSIQFWSPLQNRANFEPTRKPSKFRFSHQTQILFDTHTKNKSIPIHIMKPPVSMSTPKPSSSRT